MKKVNVLVLGVGGNVSQGIIKALRQIINLNVKIYGACVSEKSVGLYMCDCSVVCPYASEPEFVEWFTNYCNSHAIDIVFTGVEENINAILKNIYRIENETNVRIVLPTLNSWEVGLDKLLTARWLEQHGCNSPETIELKKESDAISFLERHNLNAIAKPRTGKSSSGVFHIQSIEALSMIEDTDEYVLQECVGDEDGEYTVGCYFDKNGKLISHIIMHRYLKNGGTSICEIVKNDVISTEIFKIADQIDAKGPLNIQLRVADDGEPVTFEWNVRYSGTTAIRNHFGFCDVEAAIREYLFDEDPISCFANQATSGVAIRYDEEMYFDGLDFGEVREKYFG